MSKFKIIISTFLGLVAIVLGVITSLIFIYQPTLIVGITLVVLLYVLDIILGYFIINSDRSIHAKTAWLFTIILFGFFGHAFFFMFGLETFRKRKKKKFALQNGLNYNNKSVNLPQDLIYPFEYGKKILKRPICKNNDIKIIHDNTQIFFESIKIIQQARYFINLQTFIFRWSSFWTKILFTELIKKANQGVKIRILYDSFGCFRKIHNKDFKVLTKYGIEVQKFNTLGTNIFKGTTNYRLHSKLLLVDNKIALYGGSNFADEYLSMSKKKDWWVDYNVVVSGPIVSSMNQTFIEYWCNYCHFANHFSLQNILNDKKMLISKNTFKKSDVQMQLLSFSPNSNKFAFQKILVNAFLNAKKSIKIITPYFCPSETIVNALLIAKQKNVEIEIIVPSKNANFIKIMNRYTYRSLVQQHNTKIYEHDGFIHSKLYIIDDEYAFIGSCNLDYRSIFLTFESLLISNNKLFVSENIKFFNKQKYFSHLITKKILNENLSKSHIAACKIMNLFKVLF